MTEMEQEQKYASDFLAQVYVIHQCGIVIIKRKYKSGCIASDPQLIGAFLSSISNFVIDISKTKSCEWGENKKHQIKDIGMSCSRWFIKNDEKYTVAMLIANDSPIIKQGLWNVVGDLGLKILDSFNIFNFFSEDTDNDPEYIVDFSDEFGKTIDHILYETISEQFGEQIKFEEGQDIDVDETPSIDLGMSENFELS